MNDYSKLDDYEIIRLCINGDKESFCEIVKRYKNLVYSVILRMTANNEEANDLAQEVFIKVYKNLDKYFPDYKFSTWIIRITTNHVIDFRRKKKQETVSFEEINYELASGSSPEEIYIKNEQKKDIEKLIYSLPEMYKIPIILYHQQGLSYQEISEVINEPLSKVKNRIFRGRKMLKESLLKIKEGGKLGLQES